MTLARDAETAAVASSALSGPTERLKASNPALGGLPLFLLDEFAALGRLEAVERAMGLMAGYGLQLWPILQDMGQLKDLYGEMAEPDDGTGKQLRPENQLLRVQGQATAIAQKLRYCADREFDGLFAPQDH